ncbi:trypsin, alkaline C-like [Trichoplusia ni]|uniref:trypsin n=1 Tax=Trichoplusia ni TaxID=7111 RepID=A0A7E5WY46_TRINI|nr:trypsin, alkaline C-like [Trichoplusia ni]
MAVPIDPQRIVGGELTTVNEYPTIVALLYSYFGTNFGQSCGGTILTNRAILTAGHCPSGDTTVRWRVRVGSSFANRGGIVHTLASITVHPKYNSRTIDNDVAILRTASIIAFGEVVQPAPIAGPNYILADNEVVWAAGWGTTASGGVSSEQLRHVQLWSINYEICKSRYAGRGTTVTDNMLCSGWLDVGGRDQCQGDSGGPLYHNGVVVGVCSWGAGCASPKYPGVNTRVSRFTSWIQTTVN